MGAISFPIYFLLISTTFTREVQALSCQFIREGDPSLPPPTCPIWAEYKHVLESYVHIFLTLQYSLCDTAPG